MYAAGNRSFHSRSLSGNQGVFNLSSKALDPAALATLSLGMKFVSTPGQDTSSAVVDTPFERFARNVRLKSHFGSDDTADLTFHSKGSVWEPKQVPAIVAPFFDCMQSSTGRFQTMLPVLC